MRVCYNFESDATESMTLTLKIVTLEFYLPTHIPVCELSSLCNEWLLRYKKISENSKLTLAGSFEGQSKILDKFRISSSSSYI